MLRNSAIALCLTLISSAPILAQQVTKPRTGTTATGRLPKPASVTAAQQADGSIRVVWSAVDGAARYKLYRSVPPTGATVVTLPNPSDTVYLDTDVKAGSTYYYVVDAINEAGQEGMKAGTAPVTARAVTAPADTAPTQAAVAPATNVVLTLGDYLRPKLTWQTSVPGARFVIERREDDGSNPAAVTWQTAVTLSDKSWPCSPTCSLLEDPRPIRRNTMAQYRVITVEAAPSTRKSEPVTSNTLLLELVESAPSEIHLLNLVRGESVQLPYRPGTAGFQYTSADTNTVSIWSPGVVKAKEFGTTWVTATGLTEDGKIKMWAWRIGVGDKRY